MRVAFLVWSFPEISETFVLNQATGLIDRGHEVDIIPLGPSPPAGGPVHPAVDAYRLLERTRYVYAPGVSSDSRSARVTAVARALRRGGNGLGQHLRLLDAHRFGRRALSLRPFLLGTQLAGLPPHDIVHCQFGMAGVYAAPLRELGLLRAPLVITFRGHDISSYVRQHGRDVYARLFRVGDYFLANCDFFRARAIELGCDPSRIETHHSGIDCARFAFRPRRHGDDGHVRIVSVGRLVEKKGFATALDAVALLARERPDLRYTIVGDGPLRAPLEQRTRDLGLAGRVVFTGSLPQQRLIAILDDSDILLAPSVTAANGDQDAPINTAKEAMAIGLPVIATRHGGIPELVEDGVSGFLVPEHDPAALAGRLRELVADPERWPQFGRSGRRRVLAEYDIERLNDRLLAVYARVLQLPPKVQGGSARSAPATD